MYNYIDAFFHPVKEDICEPTATRCVRDIADMSTSHDNDKKVFFPHHTSINQNYAQWFFESRSTVTKNMYV